MRNFQQRRVDDDGAEILRDGESVRVKMVMRDGRSVAADRLAKVVHQFDPEGREVSSFHYEEDDAASVGANERVILVDALGRPAGRANGSVFLAAVPAVADSGFEHGQAVARRQILADAYEQSVIDAENAWRTDPTADAGDLSASEGSACEINGVPGSYVRLNGSNTLVCQPVSRPKNDARPVLDAAAALKLKNDAYDAACAAERDAWRAD